MDEHELARLFPEQADKIRKAPKKQLTALEREVAKQKREALERTFLATWIIKQFPEPVPQYEFNPERKHRFDFAWPEVKLAVELHGGQWINGGHNRGKGQQNDCDKKRLAIERGWYVLEFTTDDMKNPVQVVEQVYKIYLKLKGQGQ